MKRDTLIAWMPIVTIPVGVILLAPEDWPRWMFMWLLAWTIFAGCKWLTWQSAAASDASPGRQIGYLTGWPGLDAPAFLCPSHVCIPALTDWLFALAKLGFGIVLIAGAYPRVPAEHAIARGWVGMIGVVFVLHFGIFHLLSLAWQSRGVCAAPLMDWPVLATSVSDFWGKRWNRAFRDLTHRFLFRPLAARFSARTALAVGFLFSGIVHELIISLPAQGGWGGPTVFFLAQAGGVFIERSAIGQRLGLGRGVRGWAFTMLVLLVPLGLLFHPPFVRNVAVPFLDWLIQP